VSARSEGEVCRRAGGAQTIFVFDSLFFGGKGGRKRGLSHHRASSLARRGNRRSACDRCDVIRGPRATVALLADDCRRGPLDICGAECAACCGESVAARGGDEGYWQRQHVFSLLRERQRRLPERVLFAQTQTPQRAHRGAANGRSPQICGRWTRKAHCHPRRSLLVFSR